MLPSSKCVLKKLQINNCFISFLFLLGNGGDSSMCGVVLCAGSCLELSFINIFLFYKPNEGKALTSYC